MALGDASLLGFAFGAGAVTFFAPCAYPLLPGYVSYYLGDRSMLGAVGGKEPSGSAVTSRLRQGVLVGGLASAGFFLVYAVLAGVAVAVGARALAGISILELVVGAGLVGLGLAMALGWTPGVVVPLPERRRGAAGYVGFGVLYAVAAAGCTAPVFVGVALAALPAGPGFALATFAAYATGMAVVMVGVTVLAALGREAVLPHLARRMDLVHRVAGVALVIAGLVQIHFFLFRFDGLATLGLA